MSAAERGYNVRPPQLVGPLCLELPIDPIQRAGSACIAEGRAYDLAAPDTLQAQALHQPLDRAARYRDALSPHLLADLVGAVDPHIGLPDPLDLWLEGVRSSRSFSHFLSSDSHHPRQRLHTRGVKPRLLGAATRFAIRYRRMTTPQLILGPFCPIDKPAGAGAALLGSASPKRFGPPSLRLSGRVLTEKSVIHDLDSPPFQAPAHLPICALTLFSCWFNVFCSCFVMWPPFCAAMSRSSWRI